MSLRIVLVDDEYNATGALRKIIENNINGAEIVGEVNDATLAPSIIAQQKPDIVFLDIEMPGLSGFDVIENLNNHSFALIFVTAYEHFAIKAIKNDAVDYILKPASITDVAKAIARARTRLNSSSLSDMINNPITPPKSEHNTHIKIPTISGIDFIWRDDIIRIEASGAYTNIYLTNNLHVIMSKSISEAEKIFDPKVFFRTHRSHIININEVRQFAYKSGGMIMMSDGNQVPLSRRKKDEFASTLGIEI